MCGCVRESGSVKRCNSLGLCGGFKYRVIWELGLS